MARVDRIGGGGGGGGAPAAHAITHAISGTDAVSAASIGAADATATTTALAAKADATATTTALAGKAATSHTHTASQISDATTAGKALLTAASVAAQQTALGVGAPMTPTGFVAGIRPIGTFEWASVQSGGTASVSSRMTWVTTGGTNSADADADWLNYAGAGAGLYTSGSSVAFTYLPDAAWSLKWPASLTGLALWCGWSSATPASLAPGSLVAFRYVAGTDTHVQAIVTGAGTTTVDTGYTPAVGVTVTPYIDLSTSGHAKFYIDGTLVADITTNLPAGASLWPCWCWNYGAGSFKLRRVAIGWQG